MSLDGTDFRIHEPGPVLDPRWWSHKFNGPGIRYELAISIKTGEIVWIHGPFPAGEWPDIRIFRDSLIHFVDDREMILADGGYSDGGNYLMTIHELHGFAKKQAGVVLCRHELVNRQLKVFRCLGSKYRHDRAEHGNFLRSVALLIQLDLKEGRATYDVDFN